MQGPLERKFSAFHRFFRGALYVVLVAVCCYWLFLRETVFYHEGRVIRNLHRIEEAMERYKQRTGGYIKYPEKWPTTTEVNRQLDLKIKDGIFNYECFGWYAWTSFRCEARSPRYDWWLHFHTGITVHCSDDTCPTCPENPEHDPKKGC